MFHYRIGNRGGAYPLCYKHKMCHGDNKDRRVCMCVDEAGVACFNDRCYPHLNVVEDHRF